jgi:NAD(P)-dependent dehydrogenase (short-subunit alcohol dehydrogenase family)
MAELDGKVAVITGAGSGMGRAGARVFVREGARVLAADISGREKETAADLGDAVVPFRCDVTQENQVEAMFGAALDAFGRVDAVLNVAGIGAAGPLADVTRDDYDRVMDVDLRGVWLGTKHGIRTMLATGGGVIVNWSSTGGLNATPFPVSVYSAAKAGVIAFTKAAAVEYGTQGIRAIAICPGLHRNRDVGRSRRGRAVPTARARHRAQARRPARGSRRARLVPLLGPGHVHHRRRHPRRRRDDGNAGLTGPYGASPIRMARTRSPCHNSSSSTPAPLASCWTDTPCLRAILSEGTTVVTQVSRVDACGLRSQPSRHGAACSAWISPAG